MSSLCKGISTKRSALIPSLVSQDQDPGKEYVDQHTNCQIVCIPVFNEICKLSIIVEVDKEEEDIEYPRSSSKADDSLAELEEFSFTEHGVELPQLSDLFDSSFNELEEFSDTDDIIAFAKKVNRLCDEFEKVEYFSDPVEHTITLARDIDASFQKWNEEDLGMFSDSEEDVIALAKKIEINTRPAPPPTPPASPVRAASPAHVTEGPSFTESGFLVDTPVATPAQQTTIGSPAKVPEGSSTNKFTESGFLIESPGNASVHDTPIAQLPKGSNNKFAESGFLIDSSDNTSIRHAHEDFAALGPMIFTSSPAPQTPIGPPAQNSKGCSNNKNKFTPSGFLIEPADNPSIHHAPENFAALGAIIFMSSPAPQTPTGPRARKPIFASPVGEPFSHTRKVSNE